MARDSIDIPRTLRPEEKGLQKGRKLHGARARWEKNLGESLGANAATGFTGNKQLHGRSTRAAF